jgi:N-acetyl-anhydromuramyl-L-alanine amidase AmpD
MNIKQVTFGAAHYINEETPKKQIYLHHTAGNDNAEGVFKYWEQTRDRVATCVVIDSKGLIAQGFSSTKWAYHLGLKTNTFNNQGLAFQPLDKLSIGIEICNWGFLKEVGKGKYVNYVNREVPLDQVIKLDTPFKGHQFWHNYTDAQIEAVKELLLLWNDRYKIPLDYNDDIWGICSRALSAQPGVYTHNSVRKDKTDVYPHPGLIEMLKSLTAKKPIVVVEPKASTKQPKAKSSGKSKK